MIAKDPTAAARSPCRPSPSRADDVRRMGSDVLPIGDYTALKVTDTGTGIPPHLLGKIFEPFFTTKEVGKGTGLGLSTVYGIVKQSGGFIFAESQVRKGTSFTIYLPVHRAQPGEAPAKAKAKEKAGELWGTGTVLIVEDEAMVRAVAERALTRHGYTVLIAENGEAALEILGREEQGRPDDLRRRHADHGRPDHGPRRAQDAARPADPVHLRLCRGAAAQVDRPPQRRLPRQALLGPAAGRDGARRARLRDAEPPAGSK